jgi:Abortive infection C-terminus
MTLPTTPAEKLPYRVLTKSAEMFGGASGLSHREMSGFFLHELDKHPNLRNRLGDAHGQGKRPVKPAPRHAELAVNMAGSLASFLLATFEATAEKDRDAASLH